MRFRQFHAISPLQAVVDCVWTLESEDRGPREIEPVLPDGCPELVMQFGDGFERVFTDGTCERQPKILFAGQLTNQIAVRPTGAIATLGVRFRPGSAAAILHLPQQPLRGRTFGIDMLDSRLSHDLAAIRDDSHSLDDAVNRIQQFMCARLNAEWLDRRVLTAVRLIRQHQGQVGIDDVAARVELTRRHLERRFDTTVGISPKRLARIVRFQRAVRMLHEPAGSGVSTAVECGYADQPHFIRDFTELSGCSPTTHFLRHAELSGFFTGSAGPKCAVPRRQA